MADDGIDPRYAAQFQRGFDPAVHAALPIAAPPSASTREAPVRLPGGPPASAPRIGVPPPRVERVEPQGDVAVDLPVEEESPRGPFLEWALLLLGGVLIVAAAAVFWQAAIDVRLYTGTTNPADQTFVLLRSTLPGPLLVAGVVAVSAWIVLRALGGARR